jgi:hypothetical protein
MRLLTYLRGEIESILEVIQIIKKESFMIYPSFV